MHKQTNYDDTVIEIALIFLQNKNFVESYKIDQYTKSKSTHIFKLDFANFVLPLMWKHIHEEYA